MKLRDVVQVKQVKYWVRKNKPEHRKKHGVKYSSFYQVEDQPWVRLGTWKETRQEALDELQEIRDRAEPFVSELQKRLRQELEEE